MSRHGFHVFRSVAALVLVLSLAMAAAPAVGAQPPERGVSIAITSVTTSDCYDVSIAFSLAWRGQKVGPETLSALLRTSPAGVSLASVDLSAATGKMKGSVTGVVVRESGYFDHVTYPGLSYEIALESTGGTIVSSSNSMPIPDCVPMSPTSGPATGGTTVTIFGGATFGLDPFTSDTPVYWGGTVILPTSVSPDGRSMTVTSLPGAAGTCVAVVTATPFALPQFCYDAAAAGDAPAIATGTDATGPDATSTGAAGPDTTGAGTTAADAAGIDASSQLTGDQTPAEPQPLPNRVESLMRGRQGGWPSVRG